MVSAFIKTLKDERAKKLEMEAEDVLREWIEIDRADPHELVQHIRVCCEDCWTTSGDAQGRGDEIDPDCVRCKGRGVTKREAPTVGSCSTYEIDDFMARLRAVIDRLGLPDNATKRQIREAIERDRHRRDDAAYKSGFNYKRATAKALDLLTYAGGRPCEQGHKNRRWVSSGACVECSRTGARKAMRKHRATKPKRVTVLHCVNPRGSIKKRIDAIIKESRGET